MSSLLLILAYFTLFRFISPIVPRVIFISPMKQSKNFANYINNSHMIKALSAKCVATTNTPLKLEHANLVQSEDFASTGSYIHSKVLLFSKYSPVITRKGYWRAKNSSELIYKCSPYSRSCLFYNIILFLDILF